MFNKFIFLLFSAFWALTSKFGRDLVLIWSQLASVWHRFGLFLTSFLLAGLVIHRQEGVESTVAELVRLAEEKGGRVMDSIAGNLIWIVVVCSAALGGISFAYWFLRRLCDRYVV